MNVWKEGGEMWRLLVWWKRRGMFGCLRNDEEMVGCSGVKEVVR